MTAPQKERAPLLNRMADASVALPTRRGSESLKHLNEEHRRIKDLFLPSCVSIGITEYRSNPSTRLPIPDFSSKGAGFVVASNENEITIATAGHIADAQSDPILGRIHLQMRTSDKSPDGSRREAKILEPKFAYRSDEHDIAFYTIRASDNPGINLQTELPEVPLGSAKDMQALDEVVLIGSPYSFDHTIIAGRIAHDREIPWAIPTRSGIARVDTFIQLDSDMGPGSSGGAIIDAAEGKIIGMSTQILANKLTGTVAPPTGMGVPIDTIKEELANYLALKAAGKLRAQQQDSFQIPDFPFETAV